MAIAFKQWITYRLSNQFTDIFELRFTQRKFPHTQRIHPYLENTLSLGKLVMIKASKSVLLVDDHPEVLESMCLLVEDCGLKPVVCTAPQAALEMARQKEFAIVVSDQLMPAMNGLELLSAIHKNRPHASLILVTGMPSTGMAIEAVNTGEIYRFITKPVQPADLRTTLQGAYSRYRLLVTNENLQQEAQLLTAQLQETNANLQEKVFELNEQKQELAQANEALSRNFERSLDLCQRIISTFSPLLGKNTRMVVDICQNMIEASDFSERQQKVLIVSAWLHNIGLLGVSREILSRYYARPKDISPEDKRMIENHPIYGQAIAQFVDNLVDVGHTIRSHHERWDGRGYPDGLREDAIPDMARYLAVACAYVESQLARDKAVEHIIDQSGKAFYPEAVRLFLKITRLMPLPRQIHEITFGELREGMIMASELHTPTGLLLLPEGQRISEDILMRMRHHNLIDAITDRVLVYN